VTVAKVDGKGEEPEADAVTGLSRMLLIGVEEGDGLPLS